MSSQARTEEGLSDPSQRKPRPWAAGGRGKRIRPALLGFLEPSPEFASHPPKQRRK